MQTLEQIKSKLIENKDLIYSKYPIKSMAIFGSFAREEQTKSSDVDIVVEFNDKIGSNFIVLTDDLESIIDNKVDLVSRNGIKKRYFQAIKSDLIYV